MTMTSLTSILRNIDEEHVHRAIVWGGALVVVGGVGLSFYSLHRFAHPRKAAAVKYTFPPPEEQQRRLAAFSSAPFREECKSTTNLTVASYPGMREIVDRFNCKLTIKGGAIGEKPVECLDLTTYDYHSFSTHNAVVDTARKTVSAYGVGSCGPRGFYGTIKPHLDVEKDLYTFLGTEDAVIYSFSYATVSTVISCFASRSDYIVVDREVCSPVEEGCALSRAKVLTYNHNDMEDLERAMKEVAAVDNPKKPKRRLLVTEGVFLNTGVICNLPKIKELAEKYKFRILLEDSYGFGAIGKTGRGTPEYYGMPTTAVDVYVGSMSAAMGAVGGFCAGYGAVVDVQRLGVTAYVFSASLPPYITAGVSTVLDIMSKDTSYVTNLQKKSALFRKSLREAMPKMKLVTICGSDASPIVVVRVDPAYRQKHGDDAIEDKLQRVVNAAEVEKIAITRHIFAKDERGYNEPSLRVVVKSQASDADLKAAAATIAHAITTEFV